MFVSLEALSRPRVANAAIASSGRAYCVGIFAAGTRPVLDHEGLSNLFSNLLEHHAGDDITRDTGRDRLADIDRDQALRLVFVSDERNCSMEVHD